MPRQNANLKGKMQKCHDNANLTEECKFKRKNANLKGKTQKCHNANLKGKMQKCHDNANMPRQCKNATTMQI